MALSNHFKFQQTFIFLKIFLGARVHVMIPHLWYQNPAGYVAEQTFAKKLLRAFVNLHILICTFAE